MNIPRIYLSGRFTTDTKKELAFLKATGCKFRCFSFANVVEDQMWYQEGVAEALKVCEDKGVGIMMDSGAHSLHKIQAQSKRRNVKAYEKQTISIEKEKELMFKKYVQFCSEKNHFKKWDFFVTLDFKRHQPSIFKMQLRFEKEGLRPIPVYHGDHSLDWVMKYKDKGYDLIGVGSSKELRGTGFKGYRYYLDKLFNLGAKHSIKYHGLAVTSLSMLTMYPWWSVDSSTWSKVATFGCITFPDVERNTIYNLHISERQCKAGVTSYNNLPKSQQKLIVKRIEDLGFSIGPMRKIKGGEEHRHTFNGWAMSHLEKLGVDFDKQGQKATKWESLL